MMMPKLSAWGGVLLLALLAVPTAAAQGRFSLPVELGDGPVVSVDPDLYIASLRLHPTFNLDRQGDFQLALSGAAVYTNPNVAFLGGGRLTARLTRIDFSILSLASVRVAAEGLYGTRQRSQLGGALIVDLGDGLLQITVRGARDVRQDVTILEGALGTNLWTFFGPKGEDDPFE